MRRRPRGIVCRIRQADRQRAGEFPVQSNRVSQNEAAAHVRALIAMRVVDTIDPVVGPQPSFGLGHGAGIIPERHCIAAAVAIEKEGTDNLGPPLALCDVHKSPAIMAGSPVIQHAGRFDLCCIVVAEKLDFGRTAAQIFDRGIDDPPADFFGGAGPAVGRILRLVGGVYVFVFAA